MVKKIKKTKLKQRQKQSQKVVVNIHQPTRAKSTVTRGMPRSSTEGFPRAPSRPLHQPLVIHSNNGGGGFNPLQLELIKNQLSSEIGLLKNQLKDYVGSPLQHSLNFNRVNAEVESEPIIENIREGRPEFIEPAPKGSVEPKNLEMLLKPEQQLLQSIFSNEEYPELYKNGKILLSNPAFKTAYKALTNKKYTNKQEALYNLQQIRELI